MRTVFHVSTEDQLAYINSKVQNLHTDERSNNEHVTVVLDGPEPIDAAADHLSDNVREVIEAGGDFEVCSIAIREAVNSHEDLPAEVEQVPSGIGELARLQNEGYAYIRP